MNIDEKFLKFKWISFHNLWKGKYNHDDSVGWASDIIPHIPCRWLSSQSWIAYTHTVFTWRFDGAVHRFLEFSLQVSALHIQAALVACSSQPSWVPSRDCRLCPGGNRQSQGSAQLFCLSPASLSCAACPPVFGSHSFMYLSGFLVVRVGKVNPNSL